LFVHQFFLSLKIQINHFWVKICHQNNTISFTNKIFLLF